MAHAIRHPLSIDLEEQFQMSSSGRRVPQRHWDKFPARIGRNVGVALDLLARHDAKATFFVGDWIGQRYAPLLAEIADAGHEIGCFFDMSRQSDMVALNGDAGLALKHRLENAAGRVVHGCRVVHSEDLSQHADRLAGAGFSYVTYPVPLRIFPRRPVLDDGHSAITRLPVAALRIGGHHVTLASGTALRLTPAPLVTRLASAWAQGHSARTFAFRLWELDPDMPRLAILTAVQRLLCYRNLALFETRMAQVLNGANFVPVREQFGLVDERTAISSGIRPEVRGQSGTAAKGVPVTIVVPCFNEEAGLAYLANALFALDEGLGRRHALAFVLVDDGSTDGTWSEMQRLFGLDRRFLLVRHDHNKGIGGAILTGILATECEVVAVMDSDCSYDPARIEEMLPLLTPDVALVTASPYHIDGGVEGVPQWRLVLSRSASRLYRMVLSNKLATYTSCFRICRRSALQGLVLRHEGYIGVVEMLARLDQAGWRIVEHPVVLEARLLGSSKLRILKVIAGHLRFLSEISMARLGNCFRANASRVTR